MAIVVRGEFDSSVIVAQRFSEDDDVCCSLIQEFLSFFSLFSLSFAAIISLSLSLSLSLLLSSSLSLPACLSMYMSMAFSVCR